MNYDTDTSWTQLVDSKPRSTEAGMEARNEFGAATISDADWRLIKLASGLSDVARAALNKRKTALIEDPAKDFEVAKEWVREGINRAFDLAHELSETLSRLKHDTNYLSYNTAGGPLESTELDQALGYLDRLRTQLTNDKHRFGKRKMRERDQTRLNQYVRWLLEFQQQRLGTKLPVEAKETPTSVRFKVYVELCCKGISGDTDKALSTVTGGFARHRKTMRGNVTDR
jgi:hypothetical protein